MKNLVVILDPAHGKNVSGKCSPDGTHKEYLWSRERVRSLRTTLTSLGYEVFVTTESEDEPGLSKRRAFATSIRKGRRKLLLSLHNNAAGNGEKWMKATGAELWTTPGVTDSDKCADILWKHITKRFPGIHMRVNRDKPLERDKESKFTVLMGSDYMGVLVEWLFQDNKQDVSFLKSLAINEGFENAIVGAVEEINNHFNR